MPISTTIRRLDNGICINADGLVTDEHGNPTGATAGYSLSAPTNISPYGSLVYDPVGKRLWVQEARPVGSTWQQLI